MIVELFNKNFLGALFGNVLRARSPQTMMYMLTPQGDVRFRASVIVLANAPLEYIHFGLFRSRIYLCCGLAV
jgi:hypothetical protein